MMHPHQSIEIDVKLQKMIAAHLVTNCHSDENLTVSQMKRYIPTRMEEWKRIKILDRDEMVRAAVLLDGAEKSCRDNTFVKVSLFNLRVAVLALNIIKYTVQVDENANKRNAPIVLAWKTFYGRVLQFLAFSPLENCPYSSVTRRHVVAVIAPIPNFQFTNRLGMQYYRGDKLKGPKVLDLACIQCVVGRIQDRDLWAVIDRGTMGQLLESPGDVSADFEE